MHGSLNLAANPAKAECGRIERFSGLKDPMAKALTVSLCSHSFAGALKYTHLMGILSFLASSIHTARVGMSAFVLSAKPLAIISREYC
jgi:NhaP-type Na+/H+ and K+/H+ antiporter